MCRQTPKTNPEWGLLIIKSTKGHRKEKSLWAKESRLPGAMTRLGFQHMAFESWEGNRKLKWVLWQILAVFTIMFPLPVEGFSQMTADLNIWCFCQQCVSKMELCHFWAKDNRSMVLHVLVSLCIESTTVPNREVSISLDPRMKTTWSRARTSPWWTDT